MSDQDATGWQPIETAPTTDNYQADLWVRTFDGEAYIGGHRVADAIIINGKWGAWLDHGDLCDVEELGPVSSSRISHWMPIPAPPDGEHDD